MEYARFEREFLRLAMTTSIELTPSALAFFTGCSISEARRHMGTLVEQGVLELVGDEGGHARYVMPERPDRPLSIDWLAEQQRHLPAQAPQNGAVFEPPRAMVVRSLAAPQAVSRPVTSGQAVSAMFLNAMVCPGAGSLVGGKTRAGMAQLALFLVGIPLVVVAIGLPMIAAAWTWGIATGAQLIAEAKP